MAKFDLSSLGDVIVVRVSGLMVHSDCSTFRTMLDNAVRGTDPAPLVIDLSGLEFICSNGMSLLVQYQRAMEEDGRNMVTTGLSGTVRETVEICGIDKLLKTSGSLDAAVAQASGR